MSRKIWQGIGLALGIMVTAWGMLTLLYRWAFQGQIYPGVQVYGVALGGLTPADALSRLQAGVLPPEPPPLEVRVGTQVWLWGAEQTGRRYDLDAAVEAAYQIGRTGNLLAQGWATWQTLWGKVTVELPVTPPDAARLQAAVEALAGQLWRAPVAARLELGPEGQVVAIPAHMGQRLEVTAAVAAIQEALLAGNPVVELTVEPVPPRVLTAEPAATLVGRLLARPFVLVADDPLTDYRAEFVAAPARVVTWLRPVPAGQGIALEFHAAPVRAWLVEVNEQLGLSRTLDLEAVWAETLAALATGESRIQPRLRHPPQTYVVQPGDTFFDIAYHFGFPQWRLEEANPDVDPGTIDVGQVLTIPSIDVLFPHPIPPGKRIEIDLPTQTLRAYENEQLIFEFKVSSGMSTTPTIAGQFQVLMKEPDAFARRWQLEMPYFMGIYLEGPDYYNGIHELPITASGRRLPAGILGWPASFGCIIVNQGDAEALFNWAPLGTLVRIRGVAPGTPAGATTLDVVVSQEGGTPP